MDSSSEELPGLERDPAQGPVPWEESSAERGERRAPEQTRAAPAFRDGADGGRRGQDRRQPEVTPRDRALSFLGLPCSRPVRLPLPFHHSRKTLDPSLVLGGEPCRLEHTAPDLFTQARSVFGYLITARTGQTCFHVHHLPRWGPSPRTLGGPEPCTASPRLSPRRQLSAQAAAGHLTRGQSTPRYAVSVSCTPISKTRRVNKRKIQEWHLEYSQ